MIRKLLTIILPALACLLLPTACSDDEPWKIPGADGSTTINLLIPSAEMAYANTRASHNDYADRLAEEGKITDLAVVGFYGTDTDRKAFFAELTQDMSTEVQDVYRSYKLSVVPGTYDLYVVANCPTEVATLKAGYSATMTAAQVADLEDDVKKLTHAYTALPTTETGLPMAGKVLHEDVSQDQSKQIVVDLKFLCAKARVTVIYQNETTPLSMNVSVKNTFSPSKVFLSEETHGTGTNNFGSDGINAPEGSGLYYALTADNKDKDLAFWTKRNTNMTDDAVNKLTGGVAVSPETDFAFQSTLYLPECVGKGTDQTVLNLKTGGDAATAIKIGCDADNNEHNTNEGGAVERGHFYDIIAMVAAGKISYYWDVKDWVPKDIPVQLAGESRLFLASTEIEKIDGENQIDIYYESDAPSLSFESCKIGTDGNIVTTEGKELFVITENKSTGMIEVNVSGDTGIIGKLKSDATNKYGFWVVSGSIRKWVDVKEINLEHFLRILPDVLNIQIRDIVNEPSQSYYFTYATNESDLELSISEYVNTNSRKPKDATVAKEYITDANGVITQGLYFQVLTAEGTPVTKVSEFRQDLKIGTNTGYATGYSSLPSSGMIKVTVADPSAPAFFSKEIRVKIHGKSENLTDDAQLIISPNPTVYTIHFKAIDSSNPNYTWNNPHIYVYQPLYFNDYPVYDETKDNNNQPRSLNWLEYSFTGNVAFKGWKSDGGDIDDLTFSLSSNITDGGGAKVTGYQIPHTGTGNWGGAANEYNHLNNGKYSTDIVLVDNALSTCKDCRGGQPRTWPGIGMTREENGWWKIELPLLAKPDIAMVMFTDYGHTTADNNKTGNGYRYPGDRVPGLPLPNYSDREAWFLFDNARGGEKCSFSDDRRDKYTAGGGTVVIPPNPSVTEVEIICWPSSWELQMNSANPANQFYMFIGSESNKMEPLGAWPGYGNDGRTYADNKRYVFVPKSNFTPALSLTADYKFILHSTSGVENPTTKFDSGHVEESTTISEEIKTFLQNNNMTATRIFTLTNGGW